MDSAANLVWFGRIELEIGSDIVDDIKYTHDMHMTLIVALSCYENDDECLHDDIGVLENYHIESNIPIPRRIHCKAGMYTKEIGSQNA